VLVDLQRRLLFALAFLQRENTELRQERTRARAEVAALDEWMWRWRAHAAKGLEDELGTLEPAFR
jgi:hypothetical protein